MGSLIEKFGKAVRLLHEVNVWQTMMLYHYQPHDRSAALHICNKSLIHIDKSARLELTKGAILEFNLMEDPFNIVRPSKTHFEKKQQVAL